MSLRSYPIPGEILNSGDFFGLSYDQLLMVGSIPIVLMSFSMVVGFIPLWVSLSVGGLTALSIMVIVVKAPEGQDPFAWAAAAFKRRMTPNRYTLTPTETGREPATVLDVIHTADSPGDLSPAVDEYLDATDADSASESDSNTLDPFDTTNN